MKTYNPQKIEKKWQRIWQKEKLFRASDKSRKKKFYLLVEFPYPSGDGLHVGHCRSYIGLDVVARKKRMEGLNVLFPMGWDAFGLPTENYAVKTGIHPAIVTRENTLNFKRQEKSLGLSFDWSREINTTNPGYYKWTQWIFVQLFKKNLAYKAKMPINWCPSCRIGLANEEVIGGKCERCGAETVRKEKEQWLLKITKYAERLIDDLAKVDYPEKVKISQREWIGKSQGTEIKFQVSCLPERQASSLPSGQAGKFQVPVFTTRPDTLFGCTYLVLAPEHPLIENLKEKIKNYEFAEKYINKAKKKAERERISEDKEKAGVELKGVKAVNPANGKEIPIFIADYVLPNYGTGAIMAVPAHDRRDFDFAKKYNLAIIEVIKSPETRRPGNLRRPDVREISAYEGEGVLINSGRFNGMNSKRAREQIREWLAKKGLAKKAVYYKLRDWIFSRQRYWGEPIPMIKCEKCGWVPVPEKDLPVELPKIKEYKPTEEGESPLAKIENWVNVRCPKCGAEAKRETDVMPNWAGSNWYYLRYCDPKNKQKLANLKRLEYWLPVDWYNGGMEHTTLHLLYSRFIYKFLWDIGAVPKSAGPEPYKKRTSHGIILAQGGVKMSKSKGNVVNPDKIVKKYGADALRIYEMFMGPFEQTIPWDTQGLKGARRFLEKVWKLQEKVSRENINQDQDLDKLIQKTIKKISEDIESLKFNTAVSSLMILANRMERKEGISLRHYALFLTLLSPFAPHLSEELWQKVGFGGFCCRQKWPKYDRRMIKEKTIILIIEINGKVRDKIEVKADIQKAAAKKLALSQEKIKNLVAGREIKRIVFVPGKLINIVV
jgi:leucyl-tRNA synthetase